MTVDTTARAEVILEEPEEEEEVFGKDHDDEEDEEEEENRMNKGKRTTSFEERMLEANPEVRVVVKLYQTLRQGWFHFLDDLLRCGDKTNAFQAMAPIQLQPCGSCGRKFNQEALQRHVKVNICPRTIFPFHRG